MTKCIKCGEENIEYYCTSCGAEQTGLPYFKCSCCKQKILEGNESNGDNRLCCWCGEEHNKGD